MYGAITGQVAVGRYVLRIGEPSGAVLREASRAERAHIRPRATPIYQRPKLIRGLLGRSAELAAALSALDAGLPIEVSGEAGSGKTALLRHLAFQPRAASFADGIVFLSARHHSSDDLLQLLFEAFNESEETSKPTDAEIRRGLQHKQALILIDDVRLQQDELERVLDIAPQSAFAVATRERCLWGEVRSIALAGLPADDAVQLLEREIERPLDTTERPAAVHLSERLGGYPLRIVQAAAIVRERGLALHAVAPDATHDGLIAELLASVDEKQRRVLLALTALPGVPLEIPHVASIAEVTDTETSLMALVRLGLVLTSRSRHQLATGVADRLRRQDDLKPWASRAITYFVAWTERHHRQPEILLEESATLVRVLQFAADARRYGEVLVLGRLLEGALIAGARWGAWSTTLEHCLAAAKATGDRSAEAWAQHQIGTRALCVGESANARAALAKAVRLREALPDLDAAAASRTNLRLVLSPVSEDPPEPAAVPLAAQPAVDVLSLRDVGVAAPAALAPRAPGVVALSLIAVLFAMLGWFGYWAIAAGLFGFASSRAEPTRLQQAAVSQPSDVAGPQSARLYSDVTVPTVDPPLPAPAERAPEADQPAIRIFTARPGSIAASGGAGLCYAIEGASRARIGPGVGEVVPSSTLTCLRVRPPRTTTYELTASGRDGQQVRQQLVIVVR